MAEPPLRIFGIPVVVSEKTPADGVHIVAGVPVVRQDGTIDGNGTRVMLTNIGEPYETVAPVREAPGQDSPMSDERLEEIRQSAGLSCRSAVCGMTVGELVAEIRRLRLDLSWVQAAVMANAAVDDDCANEIASACGWEARIVAVNHAERLMPEQIFNYGVIQDADGNMTHHMHPPGETLTTPGIGDQPCGAACVWCERGIPLLPQVRRVVRDGWIQYFDPSGESIGQPVRVSPD